MREEKEYHVKRKRDVDTGAKELAYFTAVLLGYSIKTSSVFEHFFLMFSKVKF